VRVDTACFPGWTITPYYDSLLAKVIVHARDRLEALERLRGALGDLHVAGVPTTAGFVMDVLAHPDVRSGRVHTRWLEETFVPSWSPRVAA
jgi:acetyl-CoA carboxylase biotin carboxylase subunit